MATVMRASSRSRMAMAVTISVRSAQIWSSSTSPEIYSKIM
jgi:hypothetical protein